jgi:hypothetical protein
MRSAVLSAVLAIVLPLSLTSRTRRSARAGTRASPSSTGPAYDCGRAGRRIRLPLARLGAAVADGGEGLAALRVRACSNGRCSA